MKQPIKPEDIKPGDILRWERETGPGSAYAVEYVASDDLLGWSPDEGAYYLLDRPVPPFEPYWGMVIANPHNSEQAIYIPGDQYDTYSWGYTPDKEYLEEWVSDDWAKKKLAEGWVVIAPPQGEEGVK